jgi:hypothetical protein
MQAAGMPPCLCACGDGVSACSGSHVHAANATRSIHTYAHTHTHTHVHTHTHTCAHAAMVQLEIPHVNVISKLDLVRKKRSFMEKFYHPDIAELVADLNEDSNPSLFRLNHAMGSLLVSSSSPTPDPRPPTPTPHTRACSLPMSVCVCLSTPLQSFGLDSSLRSSTLHSCQPTPYTPRPPITKSETRDPRPQALTLPCAVQEDYSLVGFLPLNIYDPVSPPLLNIATPNRTPQPGRRFLRFLVFAFEIVCVCARARGVPPGINTVRAVTHRQCNPVWRGS